jgi:hypothetical protein
MRGLDTAGRWTKAAGVVDLVTNVLTAAAAFGIDVDATHLRRAVEPKPLVLADVREHLLAL